MVAKKKKPKFLKPIKPRIIKPKEYLVYIIGDGQQGAGLGILFDGTIECASREAAIAAAKKIMSMATAPQPDTMKIEISHHCPLCDSRKTGALRL